MRYAWSKASLLVQTYFFSSGDPRIRRKSCGRGTLEHETGTLTLTNAMPRVKASASPRLHVETVYGHTERTELKYEKKVIYPLVRDAQACNKE